MNRVTIPVRVPLWRPALACVAFAGFAWGALHVAATVDRGIVIKRIIHLDRDDAALLFSGVGLLMAGATLVGAVALIMTALAGAKRIELGDRTLTVPRQLHLGHQDIPLTSIRGLALKRVERVLFLEIVHDGGKASINGSWLPKDASLRRLHDQIRTAAQRACVLADLRQRAEARVVEGVPIPTRPFGRRAPRGQTVSG